VTTILTWNVYFGGHMFEERRDGLFAELRRRRPEVILLQEVTPELLDALAREPWVQRDYELSDRDGHSLEGYGVLLLSRLPLRGVSWRELPTEMGRQLLIGKLDNGLAVATVHLESTDAGGPDRIRQLGLIQPVLSALPDVVFAGDMNFTPDAVENQLLDPDLLDLWPALHPDDPGYTVDGERNLMRRQLRSASRKRIDRIFLRSRRWRARRIELVGTAPIDVDGTFVSDHFGLEAELEPGA
jgi:tyrosyl-DNA phosphodiesterase 2